MFPVFHFGRGDVDFHVNTLNSGLLQIKTQFPDEFEKFGYFIWGILECGLSVCRDHPAARQWMTLFRKGRTKMKADGAFIKILENYRGKGNITRTVRPAELVGHGTDHFNEKQFNAAKRNAWGKIIQEEDENKD